MNISGANVVAHGVDLVEVERVADLRNRHGEERLGKLFTEAELKYCLSGAMWAQHLAGRFAAKEAILKAIGTGWRDGIAWTDIEILNDKLGAPVVTLSGMAAAYAAKRGIDRVLVSISHIRELAMASAIGISGGTPPLVSED